MEFLKHFLKESLFLLFSFTIFSLCSEPNALRLAYSEWWSGKASRYDQQIKTRYSQIAEVQKSPPSVLAIGPLYDVPQILFFDDIQKNEEDWRNVCYANYFHLNKVRLK